VARIFADAGIRGLDDLAARVGLAPSTIRALRCDPTRVSQETRQRLALVLRITREMLDSTVFPTTRAA